jgi:predicted RNA-binding protein with RPS1 domain
VIDEENHLKLSIKNVDYQIGKKKLKKIVETEDGFETLAKMLPKWEKEKIKELEEK